MSMTRVTAVKFKPSTTSLDRWLIKQFFSEFIIDNFRLCVGFGVLGYRARDS